MDTLRLSIFLSFSCCVMTKTFSDGKYETESYYRKLIKKDEFLMEFLDLCIEKEEEKLRELKNALAVLEEDILPQPDPKVYRDDINRSFKLMKRMAHDWRRITNYVSLNVTEDLTKSMRNRLKSEYSDAPDPDVALSVQSLNRLRQFTEVSHSDFANGNLGRVQLNSTLDAHDLYIIADHTLETGAIVDGTKWLIEAYHRMGNSEDIFKTLTKSIKKLAQIYYKTGHYNDIVKEMDTVLDFPLNDERPLRFLDELDELKDKKDAAAKANAGVVDASSTEDDDFEPNNGNEAYEKAYPQLPSVKSIFRTSIDHNPLPPIEITKKSEI